MLGSGSQSPVLVRVQPPSIDEGVAEWQTRRTRCGGAVKLKLSLKTENVAFCRVEVQRQRLSDAGSIPRPPLTRPTMPKVAGVAQRSSGEPKHDRRIKRRISAERIGQATSLRIDIATRGCRTGHGRHPRFF